MHWLSCLGAVLDVVQGLRCNEHFQGSDIILKCVLTIPDVSNGVWTRNEAEVIYDKKLTLWYEGCSQFLVIKNVDESDNGIYTYKIGSLSTSTPVKGKCLE